jgi:phage terminase small subunit
MSKNLIERNLTPKQQKFVKLYLDNFGSGKLTNTQIAQLAGYGENSAYQRAYELLNPKICPHVVNEITRRKEELLGRYKMEPMRHLIRLGELAVAAEEKGMFGVSVRAEELRGKVAGYYIDKKLSLSAHKDLEDMSQEELEEAMQKIIDDHSIKEVKNDRPKTKNSIGHKEVSRRSNNKN